MKLILPQGNFRAYLFDCDGTIADSMPLHYQAWTKALGEWGCVFDEKLFYEWGGKPAMDIVADLGKLQGLNMPVKTVAERKEKLYYDLLPQLQTVPEVLEQIHAHEGKVRFAVVSGSRRDSVTKSLTTLGLLDKFEVIVCAGDYENCKPHPEPFLMAAAKLGVPPEECLVFEDTEMGIQSATAAGMASVKVPLPFERAAQN